MKTIFIWAVLTFLLAVGLHAQQLGPGGIDVNFVATQMLKPGTYSIQVKSTYFGDSGKVYGPGFQTVGVTVPNPCPPGTELVGGVFIQSQTQGERGSLRLEIIPIVPQTGEPLDFPATTINQRDTAAGISQNISVSGPTMCPVRVGQVAFELSGAVVGNGGKVEVSFWIEENGVWAKKTNALQATGTLDQPASMHHLTQTAGLPGEFAYKWMVGDVLVASGGVGCGETIPNDKFSDNVGTITTQGPYLETPPPIEDPKVNPNPEPPLPSVPVGEHGGTVTAPGTSTPAAPVPEPVPEPPPLNPYTGGTAPGNPGGTTMPNMTKDDFYQSMRAAMNDAFKENRAWLNPNGGGGGEPPGDPYIDPLGNSAKFRVPEDTQVRQKEANLVQALEDIKSSTAGALERADAAVTVFQAAYDRASDVKLPTYSGSKTLEGFKVKFRGSEYPVDLTPYRTTADWLRQIMVLIVAYTYWRLQILLILKTTYA